MTIKIAFVMDPMAQLKPAKDSTLAMAEEAQKRGWQCYFMKINDLYLKNNQVYGACQGFTLDLTKVDWYQLEDSIEVILADFDLVMMRKEPPFNMNFIYATYLLELAESRGAKVLNSPRAIRDANEKLFTQQFPQCTAPTLVCSRTNELKKFLEEHQDIILKPLDGMGGSSIFRVKQDDPNVNVIIETLTELETVPTMAQRFIPQISQGDKRILMINGEPVPFALARVPAKGETRGNLAAGGTGHVQPLSEKDLWIANEVGPTLKEKGLIFVGLDVIGESLTEINVTCPTCIREISAGSGIDITGQLFDVLENLV